MTERQSPAQQLVGDIAPKLAELTDDVLFGDVWARPGLAPRDRSLVTVAALIANGNTEQLSGHLSGLTKVLAREDAGRIQEIPQWTLPRTLPPCVT